MQDELHRRGEWGGTLDFIIELRERVKRVSDLRKQLEQAYISLGEWLSEKDFHRTKFARIREIIRCFKLTDQDIFLAIGARKIFQDQEKSRVLDMLKKRRLNKERE